MTGWSARTALTTADHHSPGSCSAQPVAAIDRHRVARPAETEQPAVERDESGLGLARAEVDGEDGRLGPVAGAHRDRPARSGAVASSRATTASAVATSVTSVFTTPARSAPRIGRTLPSPDATPIATGTRPSRRASKAMTRSRRAGQTKRPSISNGATSTSPTASAWSRSRSIRRPTGATLQAGPADPEQRDVEVVPQVEDGADAGMGDEGFAGRGVVDEARRHEPVRLRPEGLGDPPVRLAFRAGRPVAAAQRHDHRGDRGHRLVEGVGRRRDRGAVADPDRLPVAGRGAEHLRAEPPDHPPRQLLGSGDRRREGDGIETEPLPEGLGGRTLGARRVDDPDLDDALGPRPLEEPRDLRPGDPE